MKQIMEYFKPNKAIPFVLDNMIELFNTMKTHSINVEEVEQTFVDLFVNHENYDPETVVNCFRVLHQASVAAKYTIGRKDFDARLEEKRLNKEFTMVDAASEMGVGYSTLKLLIKSGKVEVKRYSSRNIKITQAEIDKFLSEKK